MGNLIQYWAHFYVCSVKTIALFAKNAKVYARDFYHVKSASKLLHVTFKSSKALTF